MKIIILVYLYVTKHFLTSRSLSLAGLRLSFLITLSSSGYSWLAEQVDLTGPGSSVVFLGANLGWLVMITLMRRMIMIIILE